MDVKAQDRPGDPRVAQYGRAALQHYEAYLAGAGGEQRLVARAKASPEDSDQRREAEGDLLSCLMARFHCSRIALRLASEEPDRRAEWHTRAAREAEEILKVYRELPLPRFEQEAAMVLEMQQVLAGA